MILFQEPKHCSEHPVSCDSDLRMLGMPVKRCKKGRNRTKQLDLLTVTMFLSRHNSDHWELIQPGKH